MLRLSRSVILVGVALLTSVSSNAYANRQYRCSGRVQYRPCETAQPIRPLPLELGTLRSRARATRTVDPSHFALVEEVKFQRINKRDGVWRGMVRGNGTVELRLVLRSGGVVLDERYMGKVSLENGSTSFAFRSVIPTIPGWAWDIRALNS